MELMWVFFFCLTQALPSAEGSFRVQQLCCCHCSALVGLCRTFFHCDWMAGDRFIQSRTLFGEQKKVCWSGGWLILPSRCFMSKGNHAFTWVKCLFSLSGCDVIWTTNDRCHTRGVLCTKSVVTLKNLYTLIHARIVLYYTVLCHIMR